MRHETMHYETQEDDHWAMYPWALSTVMTFVGGLLMPVLWIESGFELTHLAFPGMFAAFALVFTTILVRDGEFEL